MEPLPPRKREVDQGEVRIIEFDPRESAISRWTCPGSQVQCHDLSGLIPGRVGPAVVAHAPEIDHDLPVGNGPPDRLDLDEMHAR